MSLEYYLRYFMYPTYPNLLNLLNLLPDLLKFNPIFPFFLALFSIMGALRTWPEFLHVLSEHGIYHSLCIPSFIEKDRVAGYWTFMFVMSKVPELGDTIFIVLRKQPLIFLHWYVLIIQCEI